MFLLDPKAPGALFRRRLRFGVRGSGKSGGMVRDLSALSLFPLEKAECHFYAGLCRAARCEPLGPDPYARHREALGAHARELRAWAANCPQNFEDRAALVGAEIARVEGRPLE